MLDFHTLDFHTLDFHTHHLRGETCIYSVDICRAEQVAEIGANPSAWFSVGLHPWSIAQMGDETDIWAHLAAVAAAENVVAIGEMGLDKYHEADSPADVQARIFGLHLELAQSLRKPLILHVVGRYNEALRLILAKKNPPNIALHGFAKRPEIGLMFWQKGICTSFGAAIFGSLTAQKSLMACPADLLFLETDAQTDYTISDIYARAAELRQTTVAELHTQIQINFNSFFSQNIPFFHV
jgi:TatD DNase family protein